MQVSKHSLVLLFVQKLISHEEQGTKRSTRANHLHMLKLLFAKSPDHAVKSEEELQIHGDGTIWSFCMPCITMELPTRTRQNYISAKLEDKFSLEPHKSQQELCECTLNLLARQRRSIFEGRTRNQKRAVHVS